MQQDAHPNQSAGILNATDVPTRPAPPLVNPLPTQCMLFANLSNPVTAPWTSLNQGLATGTTTHTMTHTKTHTLRVIAAQRSPLMPQTTALNPCLDVRLYVHMCCAPGGSTLLLLLLQATAF